MFSADVTVSGVITVITNKVESKHAANAIKLPTNPCLRKFSCNLVM